MKHPFPVLEHPTDDFRGRPTFECACGCAVFIMITAFDQETRLPGWYALDGWCFECGTLVTLPTPIDDEETR